LNSDKEITHFSFAGVSPADSLVDIRLDLNAEGNTPIEAIVPAGTDVYNLTPTITITGVSVSPQSNQPVNFSNPVVYTVTAEDGSTRQYEVTVTVKTPQSAEIVWFDLEIPGRSGTPAEGVVNQPPAGGGNGEIIVHVPSGTVLTSLRARIAQTGKTIADNQSHSASSIAADLTSNFSGAVTYTVTSETGNTKTYDVTVIRDKSTVKEITAFSFSGYADTGHVMIGAAPQADGTYPIVVTLPASVNLSSLTPIIKYKGAALTGAGIAVTRTTNFDNDTTPVTGSPPQNFNIPPVNYTVSAEDGSARAYAVTVYQGDLNTGKQITGFYFILPNTTAAGIINETAHTISVTVPSGTNLSSLTPTIYHTGASITPDSGAPRNFTGPVTYTVKAGDGSTQSYTVSVAVKKKSDTTIGGFDFTNVGGDTAIIGGAPGPDGKIPIVVTVPSNTDITDLTPEITHGGASITGPGISGGSGTVTGSSTSAFNTGPQTYPVTAEDGSTQQYSVTVVKTANPALTSASPDASIDGFYFTNPAAVGTINQSAGTIAVTVPWGTVLTNLVPTIYFTGNVVVLGDVPNTTTAPDTSVPGITKPAMSSPASIPADFSLPVQYTVTALNQTNSKTYTVTVSLGPQPPASSVREITFVSFLGVNDADLTCAVSTVPDSSGKYPVEVIVPVVTNRGSLTPVILYKDRDASISGTGETFGSPTPHPTDPEIEGVTGNSAVNFTSPRTYRVSAENGQTRDYVVTVRAEDNNAKRITNFYFTNPMAVGAIDENGKIITVTVPTGTNLSGLSPTISYIGVALDPPSGRIVNFSSPVIYTVTARNGTAQPYTVRVTARPASTKEITALSFPGAGVLQTVIGALPDADGFIPISVTVSEQTNISALRPTITHTGVSITPPGGTPQTARPFTDSVRNFSVPQTYRVTAEDGTFKDYAVSVHISGGGAKTITGFVFKHTENSGLTADAVGQINQDTHTIEVRVPHAATITGIKPTITYLGKSAAYTGTSTGGSAQNQNNAPAGQQGNTYTDTARDFSASAATPLYYTVTAADTTTQEYTVKVLKIPEITISYGGPQDDKFTTESFDQNTGLLTISIDTTANKFPLSAPSYGYAAPFDWYVDGVNQPVARTQSTLVIKTNDFKPGRHQVTVSAERSSDNRHYTNLVYFLVQE
jgi:hypothetical protein